MKKLTGTIKQRLTAEVCEEILDWITISLATLALLLRVTKWLSEIWSWCVFVPMEAIYIIIYFRYRRICEKRSRYLTFFFWLYVIALALFVLGNLYYRIF